MAYDVMVILDDSPGELARPVVDEREVLVVNVADEPGAMGDVARRLAEAGVNIDLAYTTFGGVRLVFGTDDLRAARAVLDG